MNEQKIEKTKYFLYARKSSESEDRQVQSIDDQTDRLKQLAYDFNLDIKKIYTEAKSAKMPNNRPVFEEMTQRIENGEANGILCWQINRLSRNPIDSARIQWLLQQGVLKSIQTIDREYKPEDNVLIFSVESGMANQFVRDLSKTTKRGLDRKLEKGWLTNIAPLGYLNDVATKTITKDPKRFDLIRKMWDMMLTGSYTAPQILEIANKEWGLTTRKFKRRGGGELSKSVVYKIFTNIFYTGIIERRDGRQFQGKHEPMVTLEEFEHVQMLLGRKEKAKPHRHTFAFTGFIRCGECGCLYTAERKRKFIKSLKVFHEYVYYRCTRKKKDIECTQRKCVKEEDLEKQIEQELKKYTILPEFRDWALEILNQSNDKEIEDRAKIYEMQHKTLTETQNQLDNLTKMRYRDLIGDDEFTKERNLLRSKINKLKENLRTTETRADKWLELTEKTFDFATYAHKAFIKGDLQTKKEILMTLGQNPTIKDGKLLIRANNWLQPIKDSYPALEREYLRLELSKKCSTKAKTEALTSVYTQWGGQRESNPY